MQISSRFTIAIHILICIEIFKDERKITSEFLASSVNVNPVVIRRLLQQLKAGKIVNVTRGSGGAEIAKPINEVTLLDIYNAVECVEDGELFHFHENPNNLCPVGKNIRKIINPKLDLVQQTMENEMQSITLADIMIETKKII